MYIVRRYGKPDLFSTFTRNPKWYEKVSALKPGESYTDSPDLCARVFNMKFKSLLQNYTRNHIFGASKGYTATIEFQKRGLPHIHICGKKIRQTRGKRFNGNEYHVS